MRVDFIDDERGNIAAIGALVLLPILMMVGVGVDYTRIAKAESTLQTTLDNAGDTVGDLFRGGPEAEARIAAMIHANLGRETATVDISVEQDQLKVLVTDQIETPLLSAIGQSTTIISASLETDANRSSGRTSRSSRADMARAARISKLTRRELRQAERYLEQQLQQLAKAGSQVPLAQRIRIERRLRFSLRQVKAEKAQRY